MVRFNWDRNNTEKLSFRHGSDWGDPRKSPSPHNSSNSSGKKQKLAKSRNLRQTPAIQQEVDLKKTIRRTSTSRMIVSIPAKPATRKKVRMGFKHLVVRSAVSSTQPATRTGKSTQKKIKHSIVSSLIEKDVSSIAEMQKLAIRLYKAISSSQFSEASSLASDIYGEAQRYLNNAK